MSTINPRLGSGFSSRLKVSHCRALLLAIGRTAHQALAENDAA